MASHSGTSENNRKAKYYKLTPAGRRQLVIGTGRWREMVKAIGRVLHEDVCEKKGLIPAGQPAPTQ